MVEQQSGRPNLQTASIPYRPGIARLQTEGSNSDDYRSVIDDLTVVNKRLKQKLRKYEKLYDAHLQHDKLFEVRFHGLPDDKKKELEETLRKFAMGLSDSPPSDSAPSVFPPPALNNNPTSSLTSTRFAESGYASMSVSGQNSVSVPSGNAIANSKKASKSPLNRQHQNVHTYLHDIPAGFIGKPVALTEKAKKKLVVRRLEQIFAGKLPAPGEHQQPVQQQEVAQSAARADREAREAGGRHAGREGIREARIMPDDHLRAPDDGSLDGPQFPRSIKAVAEHDSSSASPDQRPTRPLDLDPYRAQVPSENMEYIRHLGFTPPDMTSGDAPQDGHGWIYLNLLINMAQLHTFNVTPDFVKIAVSDYSSKFELSHDGRKIRWKGGHDVTRNSSDSSSEQLSSTSPNEKIEGRRQARKKARGSHGSGSANADPVHHARKLARQEKEREQNKFTYTPLFFHQPDSEEGDQYSNLDFESPDYSPMPPDLTRDSSKLDGLAMGSPPRKRRDTGPIIFYNNARFCTDLSGDWRGLSGTNTESYQSIPSRPIGTDATESNTTDRTTAFHETKGPLGDASLRLDEQMDIDNSTSSESGLKFTSETSENDDGPRRSPERMHFEVSGLGGVQSVDNFAIDVQLRKKRVENPHGVVPVRRAVSKPRHYSRKILEVLKRDAISSFQRPIHAAQSIIAEEIISASHENLPNSALPPPSMLPFDSSSGDADSDDEESDVSSAASDVSSQIILEQRTAPQLLNISPIHDSSDEGWDDEDDAESDSVDLLATARAIDPTTIHAREREYNSNVAERLAEEIPAGSSAATGVGGSGNNSPDSMVVGGDAKGVQRPSIDGSGDHLLSKNLKRARTSDNIAILNPGKAPKLD